MGSIGPGILVSDSGVTLRSASVSVAAVPAGRTRPARHHVGGHRGLRRFDGFYGLHQVHRGLMEPPAGGDVHGLPPCRCGFRHQRPRVPCPERPPSAPHTASGPPPRRFPLSTTSSPRAWRWSPSRRASVGSGWGASRSLPLHRPHRPRQRAEPLVRELCVP